MGKAATINWVVEIYLKHEELFNNNLMKLTSAHFPRDTPNVPKYDMKYIYIKKISLPWIG